MKKILFCIPLLGLAPLGFFFGAYLSGLGILDGSVGSIVGSISVLLVPVLVSIIFMSLYKAGWIGRTMLFIIVLFIQESFFLFHIIPSRATSELMGIADRISREFPPSDLRGCSDQISRKFYAGTLKAENRSDGTDYFPVDASAKSVEDIELPVSLRGRFQRVFIQQNTSTSNELVIFAIDHETGIICGNLGHIPEYAYSITNDVVIYQDNP